jgi:hypothetical protein
MLDLITYASVVINCALIYFTSSTYRKLLVYNPADDEVTCFDSAKMFCASAGAYYKWLAGPAGFLVVVVTGEHSMLSG